MKTLANTMSENAELNAKHFTSELGLYTIEGLLDEHIAITSGKPSQIIFLAKTPESAFEIGEKFMNTENGEGYIVYNPNGFEIFNLTNGDVLNYLAPEYEELARSKIDWLS